MKYFNLSTRYLYVYTGVRDTISVCKTIVILFLQMKVIDIIFINYFIHCYASSDELT